MIESQSHNFCIFCQDMEKTEKSFLSALLIIQSIRGERDDQNPNTSSPLLALCPSQPNGFLFLSMGKLPSGSWESQRAPK
jgi:hypothetical protein